MSIVIAIAFYAVRAVGGMSALIARLGFMQSAMQSSTPSHAVGNPLAFFPNLSAGLTTEMLWTIPVATFLVNIGLQWWAFWYPGAEPGGGGYIAQRIFSARDERQGLLSVLWFNVAHYAIRPWPWILTALSVIVLYPGLAHPETGFMLVMNNYLPHSMRGLAIAGFLAAFMSTVATQLNWGASYLVSDFYRRFLRRASQQRSLRHGLAPRHRAAGHRLGLGLREPGVHRQRLAGRHGDRRRNRCRLSSALVLVAHQRLVGDLCHGLLSRRHRHPQRAPSLPRSLARRLRQNRHDHHGHHHPGLARRYPAYSRRALRHPRILLPPRPPRRPWLAAHRRPTRIHRATIAPTRDLGRNLTAWLLGCAMVYLCLFGTGKLLLHQPALGFTLLTLSALSAFALYRTFVTSFHQEPDIAAETTVAVESRGSA